MSSYQSSRRSSLSQRRDQLEPEAAAKPATAAMASAAQAHAFRRSTSSYMSEYYGHATGSQHSSNANSRSQSPDLGRNPRRDSSATLLLPYGYGSGTGPSADDQFAHSRTDSVQSVPWDEDGHTASGRVTPTTSRVWHGDAAYSAAEGVNGLRVSIDPSSRRDTMYSQSDSTAAPPDSLQAQFSPLPAALTAGHLPQGAAQLELEPPRTFSMIYSRYDEANAASSASSVSPASAVAKRKKPLPLPGQPSPLTPRTPRQPPGSSPLNGSTTATSGYFASPLSASQTAHDMYHELGHDLYTGIEPSPERAAEEGVETCQEQEADEEEEEDDEEPSDPEPPRFSSLMPEPPLLKLDLDFGSDSLFSDLDFGDSNLASSLGSAFGLSFGLPSSTQTSFETSPTKSELLSSSSSSFLSPTAAALDPVAAPADPPQQMLSFPPSRKSSIRTVTKQSREGTPSPQFNRSASPALQKLQPAFIELPPSRPLSSQALRRSEDAREEMTPERETPRDVRTRLDSSASTASQLSTSEIKAASMAQSPPAASATTSSVDVVDLRPTKPLFAAGRQSQTSVTRDRSGSVASSVQQIYSGVTSNSQSSERLGGDPHQYNFEAESIRSGASSSRNSNLINMNKDLPPPPSRTLRTLGMPSLSEGRGNSLRKTSAQASAAASQLLKKGKSVMSRSHPSQLDSPALSPSSPEFDGSSSRRAAASRSSLASLFNKTQSTHDVRQPEPARHSEESQLSPADASLSPVPGNDTRRSSINALYPNQTVMAVKKSFDMLRSPKNRKTSNAPAVDLQEVTAAPDQSKVAETRQQPETVEPPPAATTIAAAPASTTRAPLSDQPRRSKADQSERRVTTDQLLALASVKLAKIAAERQSATPSTGSTHSGDLSSPASPASTGASSAFNQSIEPEKYSLGQAIRIKRPDQSSQTNSMLQPSNSLQSVAAVPKEEPAQQPVVAPVIPPQPVGRPAPERLNRQELSALNVARPPHSAESHKAKRSPSLANIGSATDKPSSAVTTRQGFPRSPKAPMPVWQKRAAIPRSDAAGDQLPEEWVQLEDALEQYTKAFQLGQTNRAEVAQNKLLPFLKRAELGQIGLASHPAIAPRQKEILFSWLDLLSEELRGIPANRGTCLDGIAAILESRLLSTEVLSADPDGSLRFRDSLVAVLDFAVEKLNEKAVYANTLSFSGRLLAVAFFRIDGVGLKLLRLLPVVKRQDLKRILAEVGWPAFAAPPMRTDIFPEHLHSLCFKDLTSYSGLFTPLAPSEGSFLVQSNQHSVRMHGNWLIRWQASDSDLPFAFYRAYHKQLASFLQVPAEHTPESFLPAWEAVSAPGFLFLAASLLEKIDSLIHRNLRSVTTLGPSTGNFNSQDSANLSMGAKPKVLEHANRRVVSTILDIVGGPARTLSDPEISTFEGISRRRLFGGMLAVWIRATVKRTSLFDARGVFLLLDFIEGLFYTVCTPLTPPGQQESSAWHPAADALPMFDNRFILSFVRTIFEKADNTICLMRTVTFLYSQFESFTVKPEDRIEICQKILLHPDIFQRMFLFWNASVRGYYLRLIVWRLSRLGLSADGRPMDANSQTILILQTLNSRLEGIRKRHDEIDPLSDLPDDDLFDSSRCSVDSTRGVQDQPWIIEELREEDARRDSVHEPVPEEKWMGSQEQAYDSFAAQDDHDYKPMGRAGFHKDNVAMSKMVNWLKVLKGSASKKGGKTKAAPESRIQPFEFSSTRLASPPSRFQEVDDSPSLSITLSRPASIATSSAATVVPEPPVEPTRTVSVAPSRLSMHVDPDALAQQLNDVVLTETDEQESKEPFPFLSAPNPDGSTFFQFEFESSATIGESFEGKRSRRASIKTVDRQSLHNGAMTPSRRPGSSVSASPRVSKRFSKRASILPPPALDLLMESSEPVPQIPKEYQEPPPYGMPQHPYAIRGLREYEDALDEYDVWLARLEENDEDLEGREQGELVPKLTVLWPLSFSED